MSTIFLNNIILFISLDVLLNLAYKLVFFIHPSPLIFFEETKFFFISIVVGVITATLILIYFAQKKAWSIVAMLILSFAISNLISLELHDILTGSEINFSTFKILSKVSFLLDISLGCLVIWSERNNKGLLLWYGASIAIFTSINRIYAFSDSSMFDGLMPILAIVPEIILLCYFLKQKAKSQIGPPDLED